MEKEESDKYANQTKVGPVYGYNEWQLCPKCNGQGNKWSEVAGKYLACNLCCGKMIISRVNGLPPG